MENPTRPRTTHREGGSRGTNAAADVTTINNGKMSDGSKVGVQRRQLATSLRAWEDVDEDGGVGGACWMIVECRIVGGGAPWWLYDDGDHHGWGVIFYLASA